MGFLSKYVGARTESVARYLVEIELFIGAQIAALANKVAADHGIADVRRARQSDPPSRLIADFNREQAVFVAARSVGTGMKRWPVVDLDCETPECLACLVDAIDHALRFRGSSRGLTDNGARLVEEHFRVLHAARAAIERAKAVLSVGPLDGVRDALSILCGCCDQLEVLSDSTGRLAFPQGFQKR